MSGNVYKEEYLPDLLPLYYKRIFPHFLFCKWLSYGDAKKFYNREISFTLIGDIYIRYQSYKTLEEFVQSLHKRFPIKIDIGAVYATPPSLKSAGNVLVPVEREIVFDIDMNDYDEIRTCCSGTNVCLKCWKFMTIACKIIDAALREDFGYKSILWVFSGRRGIHCWVADPQARLLNDSVRSAVAEYLNIIKGGLVIRKVKLPFNIHPSIKRALNIIQGYFEKSIVIEQDILGTDERLEAFLNNVEEEYRPLFRDAMQASPNSQQRWNVFKNTSQILLRDQKLPKSYKHIVEEMTLYYSYPRLDINVTKGLNHLLKAPFCVHPKSGKISVPINPKSIDNFDPNNVPTISQLIDEINEYDARSKETLQEKDGENVINVKIKEYKKTSLLGYVTIFNEFLRSINNASKTEKGSMMDF